MDDEKRARYLKKPNFCPSCEGHDIRFDETAYDNDAHYNWGRCGACGARWAEKYTLSKVWFVEED